MEFLLEHGDVDPNIGSTEKGTTPLHVASRLGNKNMTRLLLSHKNAELNIGRYIDGATPLIIACSHGHTQIVMQILERSAVNVNQARSDGWTALMIASKEGHSEIVDELLKSKDLNVNKEPRNGGCALFEAAKYGNVAVVKKLLFHPDIDVNQIYKNIRDRTEYTSIQIALERQNLEVVSVLLHCLKTDITRRDRKNDGIHERARKINAIEILDLLDVRSLETKDALEHSCCSDQVNEKVVNATSIGDIEKVQIYSRCHEFDINEGHDGMTPLQIASIKGLIDLVSLFLQDPLINVNKVDGKGNQVSALFYACKYRHIEIVKQLLEFPDINLNIQHAKDGDAALHVVTYNGDSGILKLLISHDKININLGEDEGHTALMIASSNGQIRLMEMLLDHANIDVNKLTNFDRTTALYIACFNKQTEAANLLLAQPQTNVNKGLSSPLGASVGRRYKNIVKNILRCPKTDVENATWHGISVTDYAIQHGLSGILYLLQNQAFLLEGTQTCCLDPDGSMLRSANIGHIIMLQEVLKCPYSDINDQGADKNALYIASEIGHYNYVREIISYDQIEINRKSTTFGKTSLYVAAEKNKLEVIKVLMQNQHIMVNQGRSWDVATAFSIASEKGFAAIMKEMIAHKETDMNIGWSQKDWTFQTRNYSLLISQSTRAPKFTTRQEGKAECTFGTFIYILILHHHY